MKSISRRLLLKVATVISSVAFLIAGGICQRSAYANPHISDAVSIQMSLLSSSQFSLGEPIVLRYRLTNVSHQDVTAYVGPDAPGPASINGEMRWLKIKITDTNGNEVPALPNPDVVQHSGLQFTGCRVQAGQSQQGYVVLSKSYVFSHPGYYSLVVVAQIPFDSGETPTENAPGQELPFEAPPAYLASQRFSCSLRVMPKDLQKLQALAGNLRGGVTSEPDVAKTTMLIESLFSLPEEQAWPEWQTLASDPTLSQFTQVTVIQQLRRINTLKATDILAQALWASSTGTSAAAKANINGALQSMYLGGDTKVKRHVRSLYVAHGVSEARLLEAATASHPN